MSCSGDNDDTQPLFTASLLTDSLSTRTTDFLAKHSLRARPIQVDDYRRGFIDLLSTLARVGDVPESAFRQRFQGMQKCRDTYYVIVVETMAERRLVACGTLEVEQKFIHSCALRGRLEEICVVKEFDDDGGVREIMVDLLTELGRHLGCYKISLEAEDEKRIAMYSAFGYKPEENYMCKRFRD